MNEPAQKFSLARLWIPSAVLGLFAVYGYLASRPNLVSKRPATAQSKDRIVSDSEETVVDPTPIDETRLPVRNWEDPLGPEYQALYRPSREKTAAAPHPNGDEPPADPETGSAEDEKNGDESPPAPSAICRWIKGLTPEHEVLLVPVFMTGGQTAEAQENRRRVRYAVISALTTKGYRSTFDRELTYFPVIREDGGADSIVYVGIEAFAADIIDHFYDQDDYPPFKAVVVCWLDEDRLGDHPLQITHRFLDSLRVGDLDSKIRMIGPSSSDGLVRMAKDAAEMAMKGGEWFRAFVEDPATGVSEPDLVQIYASRATVQEKHLKQNLEEIIEKQSVETLITRLLRWSVSGPSAPGRKQNDKECTGKQIGLQVMRTIGNDEHLAIALTKELILRDAWPTKCNWPAEFESNESIVLVTERDTIYGRSMPYVFSRHMRQDWRFEQLPFTAEQHYGSTMIDGKKALQLRFRLVDERTAESGEVIFDLNFVRADQRIAESSLTFGDTRCSVSGYNLKAKIDPDSPPQCEDALGTWAITIEHGGDQYNGKLEIMLNGEMALEGDREGTEHRCHLLGRWELPTPLAVFKYLRGIDGGITSDAGRDQGPQDGDSREKPSDLASGFEPHGNAQLDYLRRMENELVELHRRQLNRGGNGILAIGVVGSDVYDKLLILRALSQRFPHIWFFTTDLDANYSRPSEIAYTRNLLIASHFGLQLHPSLQRSVPPFRDSYQTSDFFSMLLAMDDLRAKRALGATQRWKIWDKPEAENADALKPLLFEISSDGPYQLTRTTPRQTIPTSPWVDLPFRGFDSTTSEGNTTPALSEAIHPPSPRDIPRWTHGRVGCLLMIAAAGVALFALSFTAVRRVVWGMIVAVYRVGVAAFVLAVQIWKLIQALEHRWAASADSVDRTALVPGATWTWSGWCKETGERLPRLSQWATAATIAVVLVVFFLMVKDHRDPDGEPLEWFRGISVWPAVLIRLAAGLTCVAMAWRGMVLFTQDDVDLAKDLLHLSDRDPVNPARWRIRHWFVQAAARWRRRRRKHQAWLSNVRRTCADMCGMVLVYDRRIRSNRIELLVVQYLRKGRWWCRMIRFAALGLLFFLFACALFKFTNDWPNSPHRGKSSQLISQAVLVFGVAGTVALVFFVVDATHLCQRFVTAFRVRRFIWPSADLEEAATHRPCDDKNDLSEWLSIQLIAKRSQQVGKLLYYPCVAIFLMALARLHLFDRWNIPVPLIIILSLLFLALVIHNLVLRREVDRARKAVLQRLREKLAEITNKSTIKRREIRRQQLIMLIEDIRNVDRGAFRPLTEDYLVRALAIPFGGTGGLLLLEQLLG